MKDNSREMLVFRLGNEEYGVDILKVQEIRGYEKVTPIPRSPEYLKGVVNLRGTIVPVVDLRVKFAMANPTYDALTVVEFAPDVLWLATPECKRRFDEAFLATLAERLVAAEGALSEMLAGKSVTLF